MGFNFEKFTEVNSSFAAKATIRRRTGQIGFNTGAVNLYSLNEFDYCVLYFDSEAKVVGIQPVKEKVDGAIEIKRKPSNTYLSAKNFLDRFGINYKESYRFNLNKDKESGFLFVELEKSELEAPDSSDTETDEKHNPEIE